VRKRKKEKRPLRALQVEVTSRCTRSCSICPRTGLSDTWRDGDLSEKVWDILEPDLGLAEHVHLQGWGEPLLNPHLPRWAARAREAGCSVGVTTNGDLLTESREWLLEGHVNLIILSAAGSGERHRALRDGAAFDRLMYAAADLVSELKRKKLRVELKLSYLLTRSNAHELPGAVRMAAGAGLNEVFLTHLDCPTSRHQREEAAYEDRRMLIDAGPVLKEAAKTARRARIGFREPPPGGEEVLACALNPARFTFVAWDGRVGPCVNLLLPVTGPIPRYSGPEVIRADPVVYGRLEEASLFRLLQSPERESFVAPLSKRLEAEERFREGMSLESCDLRILRGLEEAQSAREEVLSAHPLPTPCAACPKSNGW
jgi:MoaA/NifB/PqqE/SkfB family radical SAM enzyme